MSGGAPPEDPPQWASRLFQDMSQALAQLKLAQEDDRQTASEQIRLLQEHLAITTATGGAHSAPPPLTTTGVTTPGPDTPIRPITKGKKKPVLPDPPKFDRKRSTYRIWGLEMKNKLEVDGDVIGTEADQFIYIYL